MAKPFKAVVIGDLHLGGVTRAFIEDHDEFVLGEASLVIQKAAAHGIRNVILPGDLFHKEDVSAQDYRPLIRFFGRHPENHFLVCAGNHDVDSPNPEQVNALSLLEDIVGSYSTNVTLATREPILLYEDTTPVLLLPWPHTCTRPDALNIVHTDASGAHMDSGRPSPSEFKTKHLCISGHLHTSQRVRNTYYPGTLYQTTFGESPEKFYITVSWAGDPSTTKVERHPWAPKYRLVSKQIATRRELKQLLEELETSSPTDLYKVIVDTRALVLPADTFSNFPNVVKTNPFATDAELTDILTAADHAHADQKIGLNEAFNEWLAVNEVGTDLADRATAELNKLTSRTTT